MSNIPLVSGPGVAGSEARFARSRTAGSVNSRALHSRPQPAAFRWMEDLVP